MGGGADVAEPAVGGHVDDGVANDGAGRVTGQRDRGE
jgi:hypothetical protein